jgi:hypothetical protein
VRVSGATLQIHSRIDNYITVNADAPRCFSRTFGDCLITLEQSPSGDSALPKRNEAPSVNDAIDLRPLFCAMNPVPFPECTGLKFAHFTHKRPDDSRTDYPFG